MPLTRRRLSRTGAPVGRHVRGTSARIPGGFRPALHRRASVRPCLTLRGVQGCRVEPAHGGPDRRGDSGRAGRSGCPSGQLPGGPPGQPSNEQRSGGDGSLHRHRTGRFSIRCRPGAGSGDPLHRSLLHGVLRLCVVRRPARKCPPHDCRRCGGHCGGDRCRCFQRRSGPERTASLTCGSASERVHPVGRQTRAPAVVRPPYAAV